MEREGGGGERGRGRANGGWRSGCSAPSFLSVSEKPRFASHSAGVVFSIYTCKFFWRDRHLAFRQIAKSLNRQFGGPEKFGYCVGAGVSVVWGSSGSGGMGEEVVGST